jgi:opacity protein-like surface antigen
MFIKPRHLAAASVMCLVAAALNPAAAAADENSFLQGFGSLRVENTARTETSVGGVIGSHLTPNIQLVAEAGRLSNVLPATFDSLLGFSPVGFGVSAFYGTGGVRLTSSNATGIRPYAEASAGLARLHGSISGLGGLAGQFGDLAFGFFDRTEPTAAVGGGLTIEGGPFVADLGYRYRRIFSSELLNALTFGDTLHTNEVRVGIGVRF